jgi:hypothetical protein
MTKKLITAVLLILTVLTNEKLYGQCDNCDKSLAKDYMQYSSSTLQQLNVLKVMDKQTFEEYKKSTSGGGNAEIGIPGILSFTIGGSSNYDEFNQKREKLFQLYSYNLTEAQAKDELRIVTNPIAYTEWSKCITTCYNSQENLSRVYGYITYADSNTIFIKVKYKSNSVSKNSISCSIVVDNGTVLKELGRGRGYYYPNLSFVLGKSDEIGFTIKRTSRLQNTTISISADGADVFREVSKYSNDVKLNYINATVKYTVVNVKDTLLRSEEKSIRSAPLHEVKTSSDKINGLIINAYSQAGFNVFPNGDLFSCSNTITLPDLPNNQYYKDFSNIECKTDNQGGCGWSMNAGLKQNNNISEDKRHASVNFITGSWDCE